MSTLDRTISVSSQVAKEWRFWDVDEAFESLKTEDATDDGRWRHESMIGDEYLKARGAARSATPSGSALALRMSAYVVLMIAAVAVALVATWPPGCGIDENCAVGKAASVLSGGLALVACVVVVLVVELVLHLRRRNG